MNCNIYDKRKMLRFVVVFYIVPKEFRNVIIWSDDAVCMSVLMYKESKKSSWRLIHVVKRYCHLKNYFSAIPVLYVVDKIISLTKAIHYEKQHFIGEQYSVLVTVPFRVLDSLIWLTFIQCYYKFINGLISNEKQSIYWNIKQ